MNNNMNKNKESYTTGQARNNDWNENKGIDNINKDRLQNRQQKDINIQDQNGWNMNEGQVNENHQYNSGQEIEGRTDRNITSEPDRNINSQTDRDMNSETDRHVLRQHRK